MNEQDWDKGLEIFDAVYGPGASGMTTPFKHKRFNQEIVGNQFANLWGDPAMSIREKRLMVLGATAMLGRADLVEIQMTGALINGEFTDEQLDLIPHFLLISSAPPLTWMRCAGRSRAIWRTNWRTTGDNVIEGRHIDLADNGWQQATGTTLAAADSSKGRRATADDGGGQRQRWQWRKQAEGCGWSPAEEGSTRRAAADDSGSTL